MWSPLHLRLLLVALLGLLTILYLYSWLSHWMPIPGERDPPSEHADFIKGLTNVYNTLIELDYVEPSDISFPPHPGGALLLPKSDSDELEFDIHGMLQEIPQFRAEVIAGHAPSGGPQIVQNSRAVTYLGDVNVTALRATTSGSIDLLSSSTVRIAVSTSETGSNIAYDMASSRLTLPLAADDLLVLTCSQKISFSTNQTLLQYRNSLRATSPVGTRNCGLWNGLHGLAPCFKASVHGP